MLSQPAVDMVTVYLQTTTAAIIAIGAATSLDVDFGKALLASAIAASLPVLARFANAKGE
jgi:hypothetical protein